MTVTQKTVSRCDAAGFLPVVVLLGLAIATLGGWMPLGQVSLYALATFAAAAVGIASVIDRLYL